MEKIYNKLVRDNIIDIIKNNGEAPIYSILDDSNYVSCLEKKLYEEYLEAIDASGDDRIEELADMLEVIEALANTCNKTLDDVLNVKNNKKNKRGGFENKIFLEKVLTNKKNSV